LSRRYEIEPLGEESLDEVYELITANRRALNGFSRFPRAIVPKLLVAPWPTVSLGVRHDGDLVQFWNGAARPEVESPYASVVSHPRLAQDDADELEAAGWRYLSEWAARNLGDAFRSELRTERPGRDERGLAQLRARGFVEVRVFWVMEAAVDGERVGSRPPPPGLVIHGGADPHDVFAVMHDGFAGAFGFPDMSFDVFLTSRSSAPGHDPSLWFLATVDGRPAGAMTLFPAAPERSAMQLGELAVLPEERRRGVATALLHHAFQVTRDARMRLLYLFADSESGDDAPALYQSVGFEVVQSTVLMVAPLPLSEAEPGDLGEPRPDRGIRSRA
jgi:ribosomal protein S18 acetylase RimI-like enzyme